MTQPGSVSMTGGNPLTDTMSYTQLINYYLQQWGLSDLSGLLTDLGKSGASTDEISLRLQASPEWKQRFAGNEIRIANGLPPLDPATYIATEAAYRQILSQLPAGFYDSHSSLANWIGGDVSPTELSDRVQMANNAYITASPQMRQAWDQYYGTSGAGGAVAAILDTSVAEPLIQQKVMAAGIGGAATEAGLQLTSNATAVAAAQRGVTIDQARQAYQQIAQRMAVNQSLAGRYQMAGGFGQNEEEQATLLGDTQATQKQNLLYAEEQAQFNRQGGADQNSGNPGANY